MRLRLAALIFSLLAALACVPSTSRADDVSEAAELFASGNQHFEHGMRLRGERRTRELESALTDYFASLRHVRSRNVLYNAALVLAELERWDEAFNHWSEYLAVTGLSATESADGTTHRDAIRPRVSVLSAESEPAGAEVWVDRRDLGARGHTPTEIAVPAGEHTVYFVRAGWLEATVTVTTTLGATALARAAMTAAPVAVQVLAPEATITLDGEPITAGASVSVSPGWHVLRLELDGRPPIERRFEVPAGGAPMVIDLTSAVAAIVPVAAASSDATLAVESEAPARLTVDGMPRATGTEMEITVTPGDHEIELAPTGMPSATTRRRFEAGEHVRLTVASHATSGDLVAGRGIAATLSILGVLTAAGLSVGSAVLHDDYRNVPTDASFSRVETMNLAADLAWGFTAATGTIALVLLLVDDAGTSVTFQDEFEAAP